MESYEVFISGPAESDLGDIVRYVFSQLDSPITALHMMELLEEAMAGLANMPQRCPLVSDERLCQMGYRKLFVKNYIVLFSINEKEKVIDVERILHARRDWLRFL